MAVHFPCPHCGARLTAPESVIGRRGICPKCGMRSLTPGTASTLGKQERPTKASSPTMVRSWLRRAARLAGKLPVWWRAALLGVAVGVLAMAMIYLVLPPAASRPDGDRGATEAGEKTVSSWDPSRRQAFPPEPPDARGFEVSEEPEVEELRKALEELQQQMAEMVQAQDPEQGPALERNLESVAVQSVTPTTAGASEGPTGQETGQRAQENDALSSQEIFKRFSKMVVCIYVRNKGRDRPGGTQMMGSGFFVSRDGLLVTNYHVVEGGRSAKVRLPGGEERTVLGARATNPDADLALLQVSGGPYGHLSLAEDAEDMPRVGDKVCAIGNPQGFVNTLSEGIVSGFRKVQGVRLLQTTAPISQGSSGGPLLNTGGKVVGVTTGSWFRGQNLNFALVLGHIRELLESAGPVQELAIAASEPGPVARQREAIEAVEEARQAEARRKAEETTHSLEAARRKAEADERKREEERRRKEARLALKGALVSVTAQLEEAKTRGRAAVALRKRMEGMYKQEHAGVEIQYHELVDEIEKQHRRELLAIGRLFSRNPSEYRRRHAEAVRRKSERLLEAKAWRTAEHRAIEERYQPQVVAIDSRIAQLAAAVRALTKRLAELKTRLGVG